MTSPTRARIIKTPDATPGILFVNGGQKPFVIEGVWQSPLAPQANMTVDATLDADGRVLALAAVPDAQLAKEQAAVALGSANEKGRALASAMTAKLGKPTLAATGLLFLGWFYLDFFSVALPFLGTKLHFTCWHFLGWLSYIQDAVGNPMQLLAQGSRADISPGVYGLFACIALAGPLLPAVWKDRRAALGGALPLVFTFFIWLQLIRLGSAAADAAPQMGLSPQMMARMAEQSRAAQQELLKAFSLGLGCYVSGLSTLYLAGSGVIKFLALKAKETV